jgi:hypothetical protein
VLHESAAARFRLSVSPTRLAGLEVILSTADPDNSAKLSALQKPAELLDVGTKTVVVAHHNHASGLFGFAQNSAHAMRGQRQGALAKHVNVRSQSAQNVRLVQMIRRRNYDRIDAIGLEQLFHVRVDIGDGESLRERTRFYAVVITNGDETRAFDFCEYRKVRELSNCSSSDERKSEISRSPLGIDLFVTRWRSRSFSGQSIGPTVVPG